MIPQTTLFALKAVAKLYKGLIKSRAEKRQAETEALTTNIQNNFVKSNLYSDAIGDYGSILQASNRAGGFAPGVLSGGFNDLASDLRTAQFNQQKGLASANALKSESRMSLIGGAIDAGLGYWKDLYDADKSPPKLSKWWRMFKGRNSLLTFGDGPG
jgi:hypothetical protein